MRIVQLVPTLSVGGAERTVALLAREQAELGHAVDVVVLGHSEDSWLEHELRRLQLPVHFLHKGPGLSLTVSHRLGVLLPSLRPQVVHTHLHVLKYLLPTRAYVRVPAIVHTLHSLAAHEAVRTDRAVQWAAFRWRVAPVAIGDAVARSIHSLYSLAPRATIPNGIEVDRFTPQPGARARIRTEQSIPHNATVFITVGRLNEAKNHALLLDAFAALPPDAHLLVVGDGALRASLEARADSARVHFLGVRSDVPDLLSAADVFVLSSDWEGNPLVVMEAMAAAKPVVATAVGCVPELVPSDAGTLVPAGDRDGLVDAMRAFLTHPDSAVRAGAQARDHARARFDVTSTAQAYVDLYRALLNEPAR